MTIRVAVINLDEGVADKRVKAVEVGPRGGVSPFGLDDLGLLDLVLLLDGVNTVLTLDVGAAELKGVAVDAVDGVCDFLPVLLAEVSSVEHQVVGPPGFNERPASILRPTVLSGGKNRGSCCQLWKFRFCW